MSLWKDSSYIPKKYVIYKHTYRLGAFWRWILLLRKLAYIKWKKSLSYRFARGRGAGPKCSIQSLVVLIKSKKNSLQSNLAQLKHVLRWKLHPSCLVPTHGVPVLATLITSDYLGQHLLLRLAWQPMTM